MKFSDIKTRHIYNVIFDEVRYCEFDGTHLALVLKCNNDNQTYIVMPLTSAPNGVGINKIKLGSISSLPTSLRKNDTYAVFNQIRTVNASRFIALKEGNLKIESRIDDKIFLNLLSLCINDLLFSLSQYEKLNLLNDAYKNECITKAKDLAYNILKLKNIVGDYSKKILSIEQEIRDILKDVPYNLEQKYIDDGIKDIFDNIFLNRY